MGNPKMIPNPNKIAVTATKSLNMINNIPNKPRNGKVNIIGCNFLVLAKSLKRLGRTKSRKRPSKIKGIPIKISPNKFEK
jgi:hypothetical protein